MVNLNLLPIWSCTQPFLFDIWKSCMVGIKSLSVPPLFLSASVSLSLFHLKMIDPCALCGIITRLVSLEFLAGNQCIRSIKPYSRSTMTHINHAHMKAELWRYRQDEWRLSGSLPRCLCPNTRCP